MDLERMTPEKIHALLTGGSPLDDSVCKFFAALKPYSQKALVHVLSRTCSAGNIRKDLSEIAKKYFSIAPKGYPLYPACVTKEEGYLEWHFHDDDTILGEVHLRRDPEIVPLSIPLGNRIQIPSDELVDLVLIRYITHPERGRYKTVIEGGELYGIQARGKTYYHYLKENPTILSVWNPSRLALARAEVMMKKFSR